jgi:polyketide cyclase/dehydrase/lipid transport protein
MPRVFVSSVVDAPAEKVWPVIRRFDAVAEWLPFVKSSPIDDDGDPTRVGCVRVLTQTDGAVFREVLVALSDAERLYSYTFASAPVPVRNHRATLKVLPITDGNRSYVEWSSRFEITREHETQLVELMNRNFRDGLRSLAKRFRGEKKWLEARPPGATKMTCKAIFPEKFEPS